MTKPLSNASLILYPDDTLWQPEQSEAVVATLQQKKFIADKIKDKNQSFYVGDKFLEQIAFMGCAPNIEFVARENNSKFCFVHIINLTSPQLFHSTKQARAPHCPLCKKAETNWQQTINKTGENRVDKISNKAQSEIHCNQCNNTSPIETFNWRKSAGYARFFIEIFDIYPREAIPQQAFLDSLKMLHPVDWQYFYYCQ